MQRLTKFEHLNIAVSMCHCSGFGKLDPDLVSAVVASASSHFFHHLLDVFVFHTILCKLYTDMRKNSNMATVSFEHILYRSSFS